MDYAKRIKQFEEKGYKINLAYIDDPRKELLIIDPDTIGVFKQRIKEFEVKTEELTQYLEEVKRENEEWYYDLSPSLYMNFDNKTMYSCYREMESYESYAPTGWKAEFEEFLTEIPVKSRYWINSENVDYFEQLDKNGE